MHTIAVLRGGEKHETLKEGLAPLWEKVNCVMKEQTITVDSNNIELTILQGTLIVHGIYFILVRYLLSLKHTEMFLKVVRNTQLKFRYKMLHYIR